MNKYAHKVQHVLDYLEIILIIVYMIQVTDNHIVHQIVQENLP